MASSSASLDEAEAYVARYTTTTTTTTTTDDDHHHDDVDDDHHGGAASRTAAVIALARRRTELGLIVLGAIVTGSAYVLTSLGRTSTLPANIVPFLGIVLGLLITAHVATRRLAPGADALLLPLAALLNGIGYVFIARLDEASPNPDGLAGLQAAWTAIGVGAYIATLVVVRRARDLARYRYTLLLIGVVLLLLPLVPGIGNEIRGAKIWVEIGPLGFQPGEFAKIALAIFFAGYLVENREALTLKAMDLKFLGPVGIAWAASFDRDDGRARPRVVAAVLRAVRRHVVGGHGAPRCTSPSAAACSRPAPTRPGRCSTTCRSA